MPEHEDSAYDPSHGAEEEYHHPWSSPWQHQSGDDPGSGYDQEMMSAHGEAQAWHGGSAASSGHHHHENGVPAALGGGKSGKAKSTKPGAVEHAEYAHASTRWEREHEGGRESSG